MRAAVLALALLITVPALSIPSQAQVAPSVRDLLAAEAIADRNCRGSTDELVQAEQCARRDRLFGRLSQAGYCWGMKGQSEAEKKWHRCGPTSIYSNDLESN